MHDDISDILKRIVNPFIFGNIFISLCTVSLFIETYLLLGIPIHFDGLTFLVFFATLFLYNFHRLMGVRRIRPEDYGAITGWSAKHQFTLFMLALIGMGGIGFFVFWHIPVRVLLILVVLGGISLLYELPIVRYHKQFQKLRNLWVHKAFMITTVWAVATVLLPAIDAGASLYDYRLWLILTGRMLFIFLLALCFDARDIDFDKRENLRTIPILFGIEKTELLYKIVAILFFVLAFVHYILIRHNWGIGIAMTASIIITYFVVSRTYPRRSDYYYMFLVDGMMMLQFLLVWLLGGILGN